MAMKGLMVTLTAVPPAAIPIFPMTAHVVAPMAAPVPIETAAFAVSRVVSLPVHFSRL